MEATINKTPGAASAPGLPTEPFALTVYSREHCHLCHDMIAALQELQARLFFRLDVVDVDGDTDLRTRYGERVPVLVAGGQEICHYHFDPVALDAYFVKIR